MSANAFEYIMSLAEAHEASRRMKTELLIQMDGLHSTHSQSPEAQLFVLAASNLPWVLDEAVLRRFEKRILVRNSSEPLSLPDSGADA